MLKSDRLQVIAARAARVKARKGRPWPPAPVPEDLPPFGEGGLVAMITVMDREAARAWG